MDTSVQGPSCFSLFDPIAQECAQCQIQSSCIASQEMRLQSLKPAEVQQVKPQPIQTSNRVQSEEDEEQHIPEHTRKPLEVAPVGSRIQATYKGKTYHAQIVQDASNKRTDGKSILFNGSVYRTLTAAARAIATGINSGSVWNVVEEGGES